MFGNIRIGEFALYPCCWVANVLRSSWSWWHHLVFFNHLWEHHWCRRGLLLLSKFVDVCASCAVLLMARSSGSSANYWYWYVSVWLLLFSEFQTKSSEIRSVPRLKMLPCAMLLVFRGNLAIDDRCILITQLNILLWMNRWPTKDKTSFKIGLFLSPSHSYTTL